ncbi:MAG: hypothetical protein AAB332_05630, partial [Planctomycetota bacterium]
MLKRKILITLTTILITLVSFEFIMSAAVFSASPRIKGVNYGPFRDGQRPGGPCPSSTEVQSDMKILKRMANAIRTYGLLDCKLGENILLATKNAHVKLTLGLWLSGDKDANRKEVDELKRLASQGLQNVIAVVVGSEVLLRGDLTLEELINYINQVRDVVPGIKVTTSEPWDIWLGSDKRYPNITPLINAVDFIFLVIHPYWEKICIDQAVDAVFERFNMVKETYPTKKVMISETGWPSGGEPNGCAVPSLENQRKFIKEFI